MQTKCRSRCKENIIAVNYRKKLWYEGFWHRAIAPVPVGYASLTRARSHLLPILNPDVGMGISVACINAIAPTIVKPLAISN